MTLTEIAQRLEANRSGNGYAFRCPAHEDKNASGSLAQGTNGTVLMKCHRGCQTVDICKAIGITMADLFEKHRVNGSGKPRIVATYDYFDERGDLVSQSVRYEPKKFSQRRPDPAKPGEWIWDLKGVDTVPFRLPELRRDVHRGLPILISEGEKDVLALVNRGFSATCNPMGAGKWRDSYSVELEGADCIVIPDNDTPGRKHAEQVATSLYGKAARVRVVALPGEVGGRTVKDVSDFFTAGGDASALIALIDAAPDWVPSDPVHTTGPVGEIDQDATDHFKSDIGYADAFVRRHSDSIRYCPDEELWLVFDDDHGWRRDEINQIKAIAAKYARELYRQAVTKAMDQDPDAGKRTISNAAALGNRKRIENALAFAACNQSIVVRSHELDTDALLVGVENGVVDLRDASFHPHRRDRLITRRLAVSFDRDATAPTWERFLSEVQPDAAMRGFLQRMSGYSLTGDTREHVLPFHHGNGANGKGTFLEQAFLKLSGTYGAKLTNALVYMSDRGHKPDLELANLCGRRFALGEENAESGKLNEALLKSITGGDRQKGRFHYGNFVEYFPTYKIALVGNHKPRIDGTDDGIWRRFLLVDWPVQIPPENRDSTLKDKLAAEMPGILNWCIAGAQSWLADGLKPPASCVTATADFRAKSDSLLEFISGHFTEDDEGHCSKSDVYDRYKVWAEQEGVRWPMSKRVLGNQLVNRGWQEIRSGKDRAKGWAGYRLKPDLPADL